MKSVISAAVLGAATLTQAASVRHAHSHLHSKRATAPAAVEKRAPIIHERDVAALTTAGIKIGKNLASDSPVTTGDAGPFKVELNNLSGQDIVVVAWSGSGQQGAVDACFVGANQPDITQSIPAGQNATISFNPGANNAISGALAPVYPGGGLTPFSGQVDNTWLEYTFTTANGFSTTDVSRLINMNGNKIESHNFPNAYARSLGLPLCSTTMDVNAFVCADGASNCPAGTITGCTPGTPNTVCDASAMNGGCAGLTAEGGIVEVNFF